MNATNTTAPKKAAPKKAAPKKAAPKKAAPKKAAPKTAASKKKPAPKEAAPRKKPAPRADYGAPIDGFFAKQSPAMGAIARELARVVSEVVPEATSQIKWGMPFYELDGATLCAIGAHKAHVNLILSGPPGTFADPDGLLVGDGKTGRHLRVTRAEDLPLALVKGWIRTAAALARAQRV